MSHPHMYHQTSPHLEHFIAQVTRIILEQVLRFDIAILSRNFMRQLFMQNQ